jgi:hypothetical protein
VTVVVPLPGDANLGGTVDITDLTIVLTNYGKSGATWRQGDFNGDGVVDIFDLSILLAHYGESIGPPVVSVGNSGAVGFARGGTPVTVAPALTVTDPESIELYSAAVAVSGGPLDAGDEILAVPAAVIANTNITASYNSTTGVLSLSGGDTLADYQQVLQSVTYGDTAASATLGNRTLTFTVSDGDLTSTGAAATVDVTAPGHGPMRPTTAGGGSGGRSAGPERSSGAPPSGAPSANNAPRAPVSLASNGGKTTSVSYAAAVDAALQSGAWCQPAGDSDGLDGLLDGPGGNQQTF